MVAIPHGKIERRLVRRDRPVGLFGLLCEPRKRLIHPVGPGPVERPAAHSSPIFHQCELVDLLHLRSLCRKRLDHQAIRIVNQHHNMRQFQRRVLPHPDARRQAAFDRPFGRPHPRLAARLIVIRFEVDLSDQPMAHLSRGQLPFQIEVAVRKGAEQPFRKVFLHLRIHPADPPIQPGLAQVCFRDNQMG